MNNNVNQGSKLDPAQLQSSAIDLLRFPLAIMVIFIHMNPNVINLLEADFGLLTTQGFYNVIGILLSHVLTHIAVPTFFLISGFLFFVNFQEWSWEGYKKKMSSRVKTLLIPYVFWNVVPFLLMVIAMFAGVMLKVHPIEKVQTFVSENGWHIFYDCNEWGTSRIDWLGHNQRMTGPYDLPLWFLRDLIVVTIFTPVIYYAIKKLGICIIGLLFIAYISRIWTLQPGFHITAFFFFSTGAYLALNKMNIVQFSNRYKLLFLPTCFVLLVAATIFDGANTIIGQNIYPFYICAGVFSAFYIASVFITKWNVRPNKLLVSSCFFIYAFHGVSIPVIGSPLSFTRYLLHKIIPGSSVIDEFVCYLASPFISAYLCVFALKISRRLFPKLTLYFSGNK